MRPGIQRAQHLLTVFETRAHDMAGNGVIIKITAAASDNRIRINRAVLHAVDIRRDKITTGNPGKNRLFGRINSRAE